MPEQGMQLWLAAPIGVFGLLLVVMGWRGAARHLRHLRATGTTVSWRATLRSPAVWFPAPGAVMLVMAVLLAVGQLVAALAVMVAAGLAAGVVALIGAVRSARRGRRRQAAVTALLSVVLVSSFTLIALGYSMAAGVVNAVLAVGLLALTARVVSRQWRAADPIKRRSLLQSAVLGVAVTLQAVGMLLPKHHNITPLVLDGAALALWLVFFGILLDTRRQRRQAVDPGARDVA